jgi:hypothetical protein
MHLPSWPSVAGGTKAVAFKVGMLFVLRSPDLNSLQPYCSALLLVARAETY